MAFTVKDIRGGRIRRSLGFLRKWLWCSWRHGRRRCYPRVDIPEGEPGSEHWHCEECHPCGEVFDIIERLTNGRTR
jgi:hypothetical protein